MKRSYAAPLKLIVFRRFLTPNMTHLLQSGELLPHLAACLAVSGLAGGLSFQLANVSWRSVGTTWRRFGKLRQSCVSLSYSLRFVFRSCLNRDTDS